MNNTCISQNLYDIREKIKDFALLSEDTPNTRNEFTRLLQKLSDLYVNEDYTLDDLLKDMASYIDEDLYGEIFDKIEIFNFLDENDTLGDLAKLLKTAEGNKVTGLNRTSGESKDDSLDVFGETDKAELKSIFLSNYFPPTSTSRRFFIDNYRRTLARHLFHGGGLLNSEHVTKVLRDWKRNLLEEFIGDENELGIFERAFGITLGSNIKKYIIDTGNFDILPKIEESITEFKDSDILLRSAQTNNIGYQDRLKILAHQYYVTLKEFNNLIENTFEGTLQVLKGLRPSDDKYVFKFGDKLETSWIDKESDKDLTEFLSSIPILYLESLNVYDKNGNKLNDRYLSFKNVKIALGAMYSLIGNYYGKKIIPIKLSMDNSIGDWTGGFLTKNKALINYYGKDRLAQIEKEFSEKSLSEIISYLDRNLTKYFPAVLAVLNNVLEKGKDGIPEAKFHINSKNSEVIRSLFYNIVGANETSPSLLNELLEDSLRGPNIYSMTAIMALNIKDQVSLEYAKKDGNIEVVTLLDNSSDRQYRRFQSTLNTLYSSRLPISPSSYKLSHNSFEEKEMKENPFIRIQLDDEIELEYGVGENKEEIFKVIENGKEKSLEEVNVWLDLDYNINKYRKFLTEVFRAPFDRDTMYNNIPRKNGLLPLAAKILYKSEVNRYTLKLKNVNNVKAFLDEARKFLPSNSTCDVVPYTDIMTLVILDQGDYSVAKNIQIAADISLGNIHDNIAKDGENKSISTLLMANLDTLVHSIWYQNNMNEESLLKNLSIYDLVRGVEYIRDFSSPGIKRNGTKFSDKDFYIASFIYDYCASMYKFEDSGNGLTDVKKQERKDDDFRMMGLVISDKSKLLKLLLNWQDEIEVNDGGKIVKKKLKDLTENDILNIIKEDFGNYYRGVYDYVISQWDLVNKAIKSETNKARRFREKYTRVYKDKGKEFVRTPIFDFNDNFDDVNTFLLENPDINISDFIHDAVAVALEIYPDILITENVMYVKGKGVKKGRKISNNAPLIHQLYMFGRAPESIKTDFTDETGRNKSVEESFDSFIKRKNNQLVSELIGIMGNKPIRLAGNTPSLASARKALTEFDENGLEKRAWYTKDINNDLIIGRIYSGGRTILVTNKQSIKDWYWYRKMKEDKYKYNMPEQFDVESFAFDVNETLQAVEDYRLTYLAKTVYKNTVNDLYGFDLNTEEGINSIINLIVPREKVGDFLNSNIIGKKRLLCMEIYKSRLTFKTQEDWDKKVAERYNEVTTEWTADKINNYINNYLIEYFTTYETKDLEGNTISVSSKLERLKNYLRFGENEDLTPLENREELESLIPILLELLELKNGARNSFEELGRNYLDYDSKNSEDLISASYSKIGEKIEELISKAYDILNSLKEISEPGEGTLDTIEFLNNLISKYRNIREVISPVYFEMNPILRKHNYLDLMISQEYQLSTVGSAIAHPCGFKNTVQEMEAEQYGQSVKRNVSLSASVHKEVPNLIDGIRSKLKIAVIEDSVNFIHTYGGDTGKVKVYDGASIYNPFMNYLDNNSLGADAMGIDKKSFGHSQSSKSGIGFILKNAGFAITNLRMQMSNNLLDKVLHKKMNSISWSSHKSYDLWEGWTKDWDGNSLIDGLEIYFKDSNGNIIKRSQFKVSPDNKNKVSYREEILEKNPKGVLVTSGQVDTKESFIDNNYQLWELFGGENSGHLVNNSTFEFDESSIKNVVHIMNNSGVKKISEGKVISLDDVDLILKQSMIDICATEGAVKFGATNINSNKAYNDPDYELTYMEIETFDFGEQLDAEHSAAEGNVSLMTQVVNALGARGYSQKAARKCYEALRIVTDSATEEELKGLADLLYNNPKTLQDAITAILFKALKKLKGTDGDILSAVANSITEAHQGKIKASELDIPISHPAIFNKMISEVASYLEKAAVRVKAEGNQLVLNPSDGRFHLIGNNTAGYYLDHIGELYNLQSRLDLKENEVTIGKLNPGHNYKVAVYDEDGEIAEFVPMEFNGKIIHSLDDPETLYYAIEKINSGEWHLFELVTTELNGILDGKGKYYYGKPLGRDLGSYECAFYSERGDEFNLWELKSVRDMVSAKITKERLEKEEKTEEVLKALKENEKALNDANKRYLEDLNSLTSGIHSTVVVIRNGVETIVKADKKRTRTKSYEAVFPKDFFYNFDIDKNDTLLDVLNSPNYFTIRQLESYLPLYLDDRTIERPYNFELISNDGRHVFLGITPGDEAGCTIDRSLEEVPLEIDWEGNIAYRVIDGKRTNISIPYHDNGEIRIKVYKNPLGYEFYYGSSEDLVLLLNTLDYDTIVVDEDSMQVETRTIRGNKVKNHTINKNILEILYDAGNDKALDCIENDGYWFYEGDLNILIRALKKLDNKVSYEKLEEDEKAALKTHKDIIDKGKRIMTSFKASLEAIVSRTPAQSLQSFMAMTVAALSNGSTNSIYVSRMQIYLLGSDYDIDKASVLGLKTINGELVTWSRYFNLSSQIGFEKSVNLPFPTRENTEVKNKINENDKLPFEVMENNLTISKQEDVYIFSDEDDNFITIDLTKPVVDIKLNKIPLIKLYYLLNNAIAYLNSRLVDKLIAITIDGSLEEELKSIIDYFLTKSKKNISDIGNEKILFTGNLGNFEGKKNFDIFNEALLGIDTLKIFQKIYGTDKNIKKLGRYIRNNMETLGDQISLLIETYNNLGYVSGKYSDLIAAIVNEHNLNTFKNPRKIKDAALNFLSITMKNISKSPINLVQALQGIDVWADKIKDLLKDPRFDKLAKAAGNMDVGTIASRILSMTRTLTGKETVSIAASAMKVFEAMSQYYYQTLENGTPEQLEALLIHREICGKPIELIANSYTRNILNIKSEKVREAYEQINLDVDAFLIISALLSLATDNAKDPALSKLNAGSGMMSCYIAGVVLGIPMENLVELMISDTGLLINRLADGDIFNEDQGFRGPLEVIQYLENGKSLYNLTSDGGFINIISLLGWYDKVKAEKYDSVTKEKLIKLLYNRGYREILRRALLKALNTSDAESSFKTDDDTLLRNLIQTIEKNPAYYKYKRNQKNNEDRILELKAKADSENISEEEIKEYDTLRKYLKEFYDLLTELNVYNDVRKSGRDINEFDLQSIEDDNTRKKAGEAIKKFNEFKKLANKEVDVRNILWNPNVREEVEQLLEWMDYRDTVESDYTNKEYSPDGLGHRIMNQIKLLALFNEEMGSLRQMLTLNQGLPNSLLDLVSFLLSFSKIIEDRLLRTGNPLDKTLLERLEKANKALKEQGKTNVSGHQISLYAFVSHEKINIDGEIYDYSDIVKDVYEQIKYAVNIFDVIDNVDHYKGYLRTVAVQIKGLETTCFAYRKSLEITEKVLPTLNLPYNYRDQVSRNMRSYIFKKINDNFLLTVNDGKKVNVREILDDEGKTVGKTEGGIVYTIPAFDIIDNAMVQKNNGETINIVLGRPKDNEIFKMWMNQIVIPKIRETNGENKFLLEIMPVTYQFTIDHNSEILWGKKRRYNKEIKEDAIELDLIKKAMADLEYTNPGILDALFFYNMIAYNFSPGENSFTELFDELILTNGLPIATKYNEYISRLDKNYLVGGQKIDDIINLEDANTLEEVKLAAAPLVKEYLPTMSVPYVWFQRSDNKEIVLIKKDKNTSGSNDPGKLSVENDIALRKYRIIKNPFRESRNIVEEENAVPETNENGIEITFENKKYKKLLIRTDKKSKPTLSKTTIIYGKKEYSPEALKAVLKERNIKWEEVFTKGWSKTEEGKDLIADKIIKILTNKDPKSLTKECK